MQGTALIKPIPAATTILIREKADELQVYLLRRSTQSGFMGGFYVFPGGSVDAEDRETGFWRRHGDIDDFSGITRGHLEEADAHAFLVAAIRETWEEAGALLTDGRLPGSPENSWLADLNRAAGLHAGWLRELVQAGDLSLSFSSLLPWSHWITPVLMKRRFDTRFFIVKMPEEQECSPDNRETTHGIWISPENGLQENLAGQMPLSPPTLVTLHSLLAYARFEQVRTASMERGWGRTILPRLVPLQKGAIILEPWDPRYGDSRVEIDPEALPDSVLEVGEPFSRLWLDGGCWKPVGNGDLDAGSSFIGS